MGREAVHLDLGGQVGCVPMDWALATESSVKKAASTATDAFIGFGASVMSE